MTKPAGDPVCSPRSDAWSRAGPVTNGRAPRAEDGARIGSWVMERSSRKLVCSDIACDLIGMDRSGATSLQTVLGTLGLDQQSGLAVAFARLLADGTPLDEMLTLPGDGEVRGLRFLGEAAFEDGQPVAWLGSIQAVHRPQDLSRRLRRIEETLARACKLTQLGAWELDLATSAVTWSDEVFRIFGLPIGEPPPLDAALDFYLPESRGELVAALELLQQTGETVDLELQARTATDRAIWVRVMGDLDCRDGIPSQLFGVVQDITTRRESEEQLRQRERRWWLALAGADDGVWDWDLVTNDVYFSPGWKRLLGFEDHEFPNHFSEWVARMHPDDLAVATATVEDYLSGKSATYACEHRLKHRDGSWRTHLGRGKVVGWNDDGKPIRFVGTQVDITEQVRLREELVQARDAAEAAVRSKSEFLAVMSHEIRTPLNAVLGLAQMLQTADLAAEEHECARAIYSSGDHLLSILNDILDLAKSEAGKLVLDREPFALRTCLERVVDLQRAVARRKGIELSVAVDDSVPDALIGDAGRLKQIVHNLVGNALKFTEQGVIDIVVTCASEPTRDDARSRLRLEVRDTGVGIAEDAQQLIFDSFAQADTSTTRRFGGTGLGLTICRQLVQAMGGSIGVSSRLGEGSTFWLEIDFETCVEAAEVIEAIDYQGRAAAGHELQQGIRVLLVEDNAMNQLVARKMLESFGCRVDVAGNGREGVSMAADFDYDVIFMDCFMPEMDGYAATRAIRDGGSASGREVPIIAVTANVLPEDQQRCYQAGMNGFVAKPIDLAGLQSAMLAAGVTAPCAPAR
ncbi:MAG: PAS domain-containing protein [Planctomycetes bacterium]|nr:PAS domain-containing protein [Planctomycetota bacterium]